MELKKIVKELENNLDGRRFAHTMGVAYTAASLAMSMGMDHERAFLAGLLHDCAKSMDDKGYIDYCEKHGIEISDIERANPPLLHAKAGAYMASYKYEVKDEEIISSIRWHTTGNPDMTALEEIIFTADYIEPGRHHDPELKIIRQEAFGDIKKAVAHIYKNTMTHLKSSAKVLDPMTQEGFEAYERYL